MKMIPLYLALLSTAYEPTYAHDEIPRYEGRGALFKMIAGNDGRHVKRLLDKKINPKETLLYAIKKKSYDAAEILALACTVQEKNSALIYAIMKRNDIRAAQLLLDAGADINEKDNNGNSPLHRAQIRCDTLIALGADVNARNNLGQTPLMISGLGDGYYKTVNQHEKLKQLLTAKADVNAVDNTGKTALMHHADSVYRVAILLEHGAAAEFDAITQRFNNNPAIRRALGLRLKTFVMDSNPDHKFDRKMLAFELGKQIYGRELTKQEIAKLLAP